MNDFRLLMLGAMYENGGNTTQRLLDGHPQLFVYPFESQLGTRLVNDSLSSTFPVKYRWPVFGLDATARDDYFSIIDEEAKVRSRTPHVSKFRHVEFDMNDEERCERYVSLVNERARSRAGNIAAFFEATFNAWRNVHRTGHESVYVGYSPILVVDADKVLGDFPNAHFLHVVRNPWSAYADTKKRPVPLSLAQYLLGWTLNQYYALTLRQQFPERLHIVRLEDVLSDPGKTLGAVCEALGLESSPALNTPSWNGSPLEEVFPWGTIRRATIEANRQTARELSDAEQDEVRTRAFPYLESLDYKTLP